MNPEELATYLQVLAEYGSPLFREMVKRVVVVNAAALVVLVSAVVAIVVGAVVMVRQLNEQEDREFGWFITLITVLLVGGLVISVVDVLGNLAAPTARVIEILIHGR